jgi:hypothetical protein
VAELGLECQAPCDPFRRTPNEGEHHEADEDTWPQRILVALIATRMSVPFVPECKVARAIRRPSASVARKSDYLQRDSTRASRFVL